MRAKTLILALTGLLAAGVSTPAPATIWNFLTSGCSTVGSSDGNQRNCSQDGVNVTGTAWANTADTLPNPPGPANSIISAAIVTVHTSSNNGLGVNNADRSGGPGGNGDGNEGSSPEHAVDNNDRKDSILLTFATPVKLTHVMIGYSNTDSDMTVMGFTSGSCNGTVSGQTYAGLTGCGWTFVSNLSDVAEDSFRSINNASLFSQYWLVGTYLSDATSGSLNPGNDHIKLLAVKGDRPNVPEPATLLLLATAAAGLWWRRRVA